MCSRGGKIRKALHDTSTVCRIMNAQEMGKLWEAHGMQTLQLSCLQSIVALFKENKYTTVEKIKERSPNSAVRDSAVVSKIQPPSMAWLSGLGLCNVRDCAQ